MENLPGTPFGAPRGDYIWSVIASNISGSDVGAIKDSIIEVPEPASFALLGLAVACASMIVRPYQRVMSIVRQLVTASFIVLTLTFAANAAILGVATRQSGAPGGVAFTSFEGTAPAPNLNTIVNGTDSAWVSYLLSIQTTAGETVSSINPTITSLGPAGGFHQRWGFDADAETYTVATPSTNSTAGTNLTNGDSKLIVQGSLVLAPPTENRIAKTSDSAGTTPGFNTPHMTITDGVRNWGVGTTMSGNWGFTPAEQAAQAGNVPFAYIVVPRGSTPSIDILAIFTANDANGVPFPQPFLLTELGISTGTPPNILDRNVGQIDRNAVTGLGPLPRSSGTTPFNWSLVSFTGTTEPAPAPTVDPTTGKFSWATNNSVSVGTYSALIRATNAWGSDSATLTFEIVVPEPAYLTLLAIAAIFTGCHARCRP